MAHRPQLTGCVLHKQVQKAAMDLILYVFQNSEFMCRKILLLILSQGKNKSY